jgi:hypothetical protein
MLRQFLCKVYIQTLPDIGGVCPRILNETLTKTFQTLLLKEKHKFKKGVFNIVAYKIDVGGNNTDKCDFNLQTHLALILKRYDTVHIRIVWKTITALD